MKILLPLQQVQLYIVLGVYNTYTSNDLDNYALLNHTHSNYVTSSEVSTIVNENIQSGVIQVSGSVIRKITRGTSSSKGDVTISCSIIDPDKVIVLLDVDCCYSDYIITNHGSCSAGSPGVYLKSVSNSNIIVSGGGFYASYGELESSSIEFSYQIIEFM